MFNRLDTLSAFHATGNYPYYGIPSLGKTRIKDNILKTMTLVCFTFSSTAFETDVMQKLTNYTITNIILNIHVATSIKYRDRGTNIYARKTCSHLKYLSSNKFVLLL